MDQINQDLQKKSRKKKNIIALVILVVGIILSFVFFGPKKEEAVVENNKAIKEVETFVLGDGQQELAYLEKTVELDSEQSADAVAEYSGRVSRATFDVGDFVNEGTILVEFDQSNDSNSYKVSFESAQKSYDLAKKALGDAKDSAEKSVDLAENAVDLAELQLKQAKDDGDEDEIDLAEEALKTAKDREDQAEITADAQVNSAKIQLQQAELQLQQAQIGFDKTFVKAPISGYVVSKKISSNDYLSAGQKVAQISKGGELQATVYLTETEAFGIAKDSSVNVLLNNNEKLMAKVKAVSAIANSSNQRFEALVEIDSNDQKLINQNVRIEIPLKLENGSGFFVPLKAVNIGQRRNEVFIVEEGKALSVEVEMGQIVGEQVEIVEGLKNGDELIISGNRRIRDGEEIKVIEKN